MEVDKKQYTVVSAQIGFLPNIDIYENLQVVLTYNNLIKNEYKIDELFELLEINEVKHQRVESLKFHELFYTKLIRAVLVEKDIFVEKIFTQEPTLESFQSFLDILEKLNFTKELKVFDLKSFQSKYKGFL